MRRHSNDADRGQAYTLEGFVGAIVVLTAVLFALQAVVLTPTTGGAVDRTAQAQVEQQVQDALIVSANEGELSEMARYWDPSTERFHNETPMNDAVYNNSRFAYEFNLGKILNEHFVEQRGDSYNVQLITYDDDGKNETIDFVRMGGGSSSSAVSASYTIVLYDDQILTEPGSDGPEERGDGTTVRDAWDNHDYRVPPGNAGGGVYEVVEIRVTVW